MNDTLRPTANDEACAFQAYVAERVRLGGDVRAVMLGACIVMGNLVAAVDAVGHRQSCIDALTNTIRYNALLAGPEAGYA